MQSLHALLKIPSLIFLIGTLQVLEGARKCPQSLLFSLCLLTAESIFLPLHTLLSMPILNLVMALNQLTLIHSQIFDTCACSACSLFQKILVPVSRRYIHVFGILKTISKSSSYHFLLQKYYFHGNMGQKNLTLKLVLATQTRNSFLTNCLLDLVISA